MSKAEEKDFSVLTEAQAERDYSLVEGIRKLYVLPLLDELEAAIPSYCSLSEWDKYAALMKMNNELVEECKKAGHCFGDSLPLDFGGAMYGTMYAGRSAAIPQGHPKTAVRYIAGFSSSIEDRCGYNFTDTCFLDGASYYLAPLPFKIAAVALHIQQSILIPHVEACRFAAGIDSQTNPRRIMITGIKSDLGQVIAWDIRIRDTHPENRMLEDIARLLRNYVEEDTAKTINAGRYSITPYAEFAPAGHADHVKEARTRDGRTDALYNFVKFELPTMGYHAPGQAPENNTDLEGISWKRAQRLFEEVHPLFEKYKDSIAFQKSFRQAASVRESR